MPYSTAIREGEVEIPDNTFNHTQFSGVNQTARWQCQNQIDPTFLDPTNASDPRRVQFAFRLNF